MTRPLAAALALSIIVMMIGTPAGAECTDEPSFAVIDGDTLRLIPEDRLVRLVGYDTPETGRGARCASEAQLADQARERLRSLLYNYSAILCLPGTECGFGRLCGVLLVQRGGYTLDVGSILIEEGLARPFTGQRESWCPTD